MTQATPPSHDEVIAFMHSRHDQTVLHALGVRMVKFDKDESVVEVEVSERLFQHAGIVHGGVYVLLAESAASIAAALSVDLGRFRVAGQEISASHVRPSTEGTLRAVARPLHTGRTAIVYDCRVENDGKLVSTCRCTIAVRPNAA
jgi:1,4-dihydroxy-2-naphthoyl-CoA hydrolase